MSSDEQIEIRQAENADAKLIAVLGAVTFYEAYFEYDDAGDLAKYICEAFAPEKIAAKIAAENSTFFIIYRNGKAVGYAKLRADSKADCIADINSIELQRIYILERVFGSGIGETLLKHCLKTATERDYSTLWLGVWEQNFRAQKFYEKHGFTRVGTLTFPYGETVGTNFVMKIEL